MLGDFKVTQFIPRGLILLMLLFVTGAVLSTGIGFAQEPSDEPNSILFVPMIGLSADRHAITTDQIEDDEVSLPQSIATSVPVQLYVLTPEEQERFKDFDAEKLPFCDEMPIDPVTNQIIPLEPDWPASLPVCRIRTKFLDLSDPNMVPLSTIHGSRPSGLPQEKEETENE